MINYWLDRFKEGRMVAYRGSLHELRGKVGFVIKSQRGKVEVEFEFPGMFVSYKKIFTIDKSELELI
jgi:hypothetical protein